MSRRRRPNATQSNRLVESCYGGETKNEVRFNQRRKYQQDLNYFLKPTSTGAKSLYHELERAGRGYGEKDLTYTKERMAVLSLLSGIPRNDQGSKHLGLVPRNKQNKIQHWNEQDHTSEIDDNYEYSKRVAFADRMNALVAEMAQYSDAGRPVPGPLWSKYDKLNKAPAFNQGLRPPPPGPATYRPLADRSSLSKSAPAFPFAQGGEAAPGGPGAAAEGGGGGGARSPLGAAARRALDPMRKTRRHWGRREIDYLNRLYYDLGRPRRGLPAPSLLDAYAQRHLKVFPQRGAAEVRERVASSWRHNRFRERGEPEYWSNGRSALPDLAEGRARRGPAAAAAGAAGEGAHPSSSPAKAPSEASSLSTASDFDSAFPTLAFTAEGGTSLARQSTYDSVTTCGGGGGGGGGDDEGALLEEGVGEEKEEEEGSNLGTHRTIPTATGRSNNAESRQQGLWSKKFEKYAHSRII